MYKPLASLKLWKIFTIIFPIKGFGGVVSLREDLRQKVNASEDLFPVDQNSKMRLTGQVREGAGPCPDHMFLILELRRFP